jgi:DNA-binding NarL/FixJ family response regulator
VSGAAGVRSVVVAHHEAMVAEAIAAGLAQHPWITILGTASSSAEADVMAGDADVIVIDERLSGTARLANRSFRRGLRVVFFGEAPGNGDGQDEEGGLRVSTSASLGALASAIVPSAPAASGPGSLTPRQEEILSLVARGFAAKQVARHLGISTKTVEHHKSRIFAKLGVPNQAAAVSRILHERPRRSPPGSHRGFPPMVRPSETG